MSTRITAAQSGSSPSTCSAYARRKARYEAQVVKQVREEGGFSVFWATENIDRARAIDRLHRKLGVIEPQKGRGNDRFPWSGYKLNTPNAKGEAQPPAKNL